MPEGSLVALIRRKGETIIPRGQTVLEEGDRLTIIGDAHGIEKLNNEYS
jgi:Trk K+ transport system NAD-binding subunit